MPDVWTTNPEKLRKALSEVGASCGSEARVLKPRDPAWTCHLDPLPARYDVYIHSWRDFYSHPYFLSPLVLGTIAGILIGLVWGKGFWRRCGNP